MRKKEEEYGYYYFVGRVLLKERKRFGKSQESVAEKLGIHSSDLSRLENGKKPFTEDLLFDICRLYRVQVGEVTSKAHGLYQDYLRERAARQDESLELSLPDHPFARRIVEIYDRYAQSQNDKEREGHEKTKELLLALLRYVETLNTAR